MNINKNIKSCEKDYSNYSYQLKQQKLGNYFHNMFANLKNSKNLEKKKKLKSMLTSNIVNYKNAKINNKKSNIKKNLESSINLSKNNFCGSFLVPDYVFVTGAEILGDLKTKGAERTVIRHFSKDVPKANFLKNKNNLKSCSVTRNKGPNIKSKYFDLINSNISRINKMTTFKKSKTVKYPNRLRYYDKYNKSFLNYFNGGNLKSKKTKNNYFDFKEHNDKFYKNSAYNINNINKQSFYSSTLNNSKTYLSSSTSCSSKNLKYLKKN